MVKLTEAACLDNVNRMIDFILRETGAWIALTKRECLELRLVSEEILVNIVRYAYPKTGDITVELEFDEEKKALVLCVVDSGKAFNPLQKQEPDLTVDIMDREIGGLGIHMIKTLTDSVSYERTDGLNKLTVTKSFEREGA